MQKLLKHQNLSRANRIRPNNFTPITSGMGRDEIFCCLLIKNTIILKFPIWAIRNISGSQMVQSLKLNMLQHIIRQIPRGTIPTLNHITCKRNPFLRSNTPQKRNAFGRTQKIIPKIYSTTMINSP